MRLVALEFSGFRRFANPQRLDVDNALTAIVGPNEAGKTSLIEAMRRLDDRDPIGHADRTRRQQVADDDFLVEALYLIEDADLEIIADLHGADDPKRTRWFLVKKRASGQLVTELRDGLARDRGPRREASAAVQKLLKRSVWDPEEHENASPLGAEGIDAIRAALETDDATLDASALQAIASFADSLEELGQEEASETIAILRSAYVHENAEHPNATARRLLHPRTPDFLFFDEEERELRSDYDLTDVAADPPPALANLARLAELDLPGLLQLIHDDESGTIVEVLQEANARLQQAFRAWSQETIAVRFDRDDGNVIRLHVSNPAGGFSKLEERSDGLKMFVALLGLKARAQHGIPPIVLIDELERHLHYDAQADVVQVFAKQEALPQIIYTTHSAGCLPEDLGTGVRLVGPIADTNHSRVQNRFWTQGEGFSPLLVGMGASTLAFVPVRNALMSEGATEIILLPTLLREATGLKSLGFQVAPASSEAPATHIGGLDREAGRVAWVVDGDEGGRNLRARLRGARIPADRILSLAGERSEMVIEDVLEADIYVAAFNEELRRSGAPTSLPKAAIRGNNRPRRAREWCEKNSVHEPSKVNVAYRVIERRRESGALLDRRGRQVLRVLHERATAIFDAEDVIPSMIEDV